MSDIDTTSNEHPRGTLAILAVYGAIFALVWLAMYFLVYTPRGGVHP